MFCFSPWVPKYLSGVIWTMLSYGQTTQPVTSMVKVTRLPRFVNQTTSRILQGQFITKIKTFFISTDLTTNQQILLQSSFITNPT